MSYINWNLAGGNNALAAFGQGMEIGNFLRNRKVAEAEDRRKTETQSALSAYAVDPNEANLNALASYAPEMVIQQRNAMEQRQAAQSNRQMEQRRADLPMLTRLLTEASKSREKWQNAISEAQRLGIDTTGIPQQFDPEWATAQATTMGALQTPEGTEALSNAGKIAVDMGFKPGTAEFNTKVGEIFQQQGAIPYTDAQGATRLYLPGRNSAPGPEVGSVVQGYRFKGGNPSDRGNWEQVGGGVSNGTGGFPTGQ